MNGQCFRSVVVAFLIHTKEACSPHPKLGPFCAEPLTDACE
jgi:hypothetical protein